MPLIGPGRALALHRRMRTLHSCARQSWQIRHVPRMLVPHGLQHANRRRLTRNSALFRRTRVRPFDEGGLHASSALIGRGPATAQLSEARVGIATRKLPIRAPGCRDTSAIRVGRRSASAEYARRRHAVRRSSHASPTVVMPRISSSQSWRSDIDLRRRHAGSRVVEPAPARFAGKVGGRPVDRASGRGTIAAFPFRGGPHAPTPPARPVRRSARRAGA